MSRKTREAGGMWEMGNEKQGLGTGNKGLPAATACQHHSLNLSCDSRKPINFENEFFFLTDRTANVIENKGSLWKTQGLTVNVLENKGSYSL
jgi:hypothetical protein